MKRTTLPIANALLKIIRAIHFLSAEKAGQIMGVSKGVVDSWSSNPASTAYRPANLEAVNKLRQFYSMDIWPKNSYHPDDPNECEGGWSGER